MEKYPIFRTWLQKIFITNMLSINYSHKLSFKIHSGSFVSAANMPSRLRKAEKFRGHISPGHSHTSKHWKHLRNRDNAGNVHQYRIIWES